MLMPMFNPVLGGADNFFTDIQGVGLDTNLVLCLDAGVEASLASGAQKWLDLTSNGYDFILGATHCETTDDPTIVNAGAKDSTAYLSFDSGDHLLYDTTNETWMENQHKDNAAFSMACFIYYPPAGIDADIAGTCAGGGGNNVGWHWKANPAQRFRIEQNGTNDTIFTCDNSPATGWHFIAFSIDEATGAGGGFAFIDGAYDQVGSSDTFDASYGAPSANAATYTMQIGASGNNSRPLSAGARLGGFFVWDTNLSFTQIDSVYDAVKARYGLS